MRDERASDRAHRRDLRRRHGAFLHPPVRKRPPAGPPGRRAGPPPLCEDVAELDRLEGELATARGALAERLHPLVPAAAPGLRRFLLAVKRDAHNGRPLSRHAASPLWPQLGELAGGEAGRALALEE